MLIGCTAKPYEYKELSQVGFDYAEFPCRVISDMSDGDFFNLKKQVEEVSFPILCMNAYCPPEVAIAGPNFDEIAIAQYARRAANRGSTLGVRAIVIGSPQSRLLPNYFNRTLAKKQLLKFLRITSEEFGIFGIKTTLEALAPCFCNFVNKLPDAYEIVQELDNHNIGLTMDFYNMEHSDEADIDLKKFADKIHHTHISDDDGSPAMRSYLNSEKYSVHASRINRLKQISYNATLTIEIDVSFDSARAEHNLLFLKSL